MGFRASPPTSCGSGSLWPFYIAQIRFLDLPGVVSSSSLCLLQSHVAEEPLSMQGSVPHGRLSFYQLSSGEPRLASKREQGQRFNLQSILMCLQHKPRR